MNIINYADLATPFLMTWGDEAAPAKRILPDLMAFPVEVLGEGYMKFERVAKGRMRRYVEHVIGETWYETDGDAYVVVYPRAVESTGRELTPDEVALMAWAIRDYRITQDAKRRARPSKMFAR